MREIHSQQPTTEQLLSFQSGDPVAINEVIELVLPQLAGWACHLYPVLPPEDVHDVVFQVLAEICQHHARYDPNRAKFTTYAFGLIKRRLTDLYATWIKINEFEESGPDAHEKLLSLPYNDVERPDADVLLTRDEFFQQAETRLSDLEREVCSVMRTSDDPHLITEILERYGDTSEVKNVRAIIRRKLTALAAELHYQQEDVL
jgi:Sigma-70 region 2